MKPIDELLRNLRRPEVLEFALASERLPCVKVGASFQPVDGGAPTTDQVLEMLVGAGGSRYVDSLHDAPTRWTFRLEGVGTIAISAVLRAGVVQARFTLTKRETVVRTDSETMHTTARRGEAAALHPGDDDEPTMVTDSVASAQLDNAPLSNRGSVQGSPPSRPGVPPSSRFVPPPAPPPISAARPVSPPDPSGQAIVNRGAAAAPAHGPVSSVAARPQVKPPMADRHALPRLQDGDAETTESIELDFTRTDARMAAGGVPAALGGAPPPPPAKIGPPARYNLAAALSSSGASASAPSSGSSSPASLRDLLTHARSVSASDLHVIALRPTLIRIAGDLAARPGFDAVLSEADVEKIVRAIVPPRLLQFLEEDGSCDFAFDEEGLGRVRANVSRQRTGYKISLRLIPAGVPTLASLGLPETIGAATHHHQGLIVVTGPTGHGKTTTLAALVDQINRDTTHHVITVEDPIEYVHPRKRATMSQREVGRHTKSFAAALKASLRQDPDVIVVGELRDTETVRMALSASETGHLVLGTMNTPSAAKTIDRLIDLFPPSDQAQVRATLAGGLRMVVSQRLLPGADGSSMVAASEILPGSTALYTLIRENKTFQIPSLQQRGRAAGMLRLDESLADLVRAGKTTLEYARAASEAPDELEAQLRGPAPNLGPGGASAQGGAGQRPGSQGSSGSPGSGPRLDPGGPGAGVGSAGGGGAGDKRGGQPGNLFQRAGSLFNKKEG